MESVSVRGRRQWRERGRNATSAALRVMAACLALLLVASSLGQVAHFLLVPHAICAEHGELVELSPGADHGGQHLLQVEPAAHDAGPSVSPEELASHDHCEILASAQRQLALPAASVVALVPVVASSSLALVEPSAAQVSLSPLAVAPKTSPPACGAQA